MWLSTVRGSERTEGGELESESSSTVQGTRIASQRCYSPGHLSVTRSPSETWHCIVTKCMSNDEMFQFVKQYGTSDGDIRRRNKKDTQLHEIKRLCLWRTLHLGRKLGLPDVDHCKQSWGSRCGIYPGLNCSDERFPNRYHRVE